MNEIWKRISGFEYYEVSNFGAVRSLNRVEVRTRKGVEYVHRLEGRFLSQRTDRRGNMYVVLSVSNNRIKRHVSKLVVEAFIKPPYDKYLIKHRSPDKGDNSVINLICKKMSEKRYCKRGCGNVLQKGKRVCDKCIDRELTNTKPKASAKDLQRAKEYLKSIGRMVKE